MITIDEKSLRTCSMVDCWINGKRVTVRDGKIFVNGKEVTYHEAVKLGVIAK